MAVLWRRLAASAASWSVVALIGCGGGSGGSGGSVAPNTIVPISVIDGPIQNATVCLDKNNNSLCDASEPLARTDAAGNANLVIDNADLGKYPVLAVVGTDAVDIDTGAVPTPFTMSAPADRPALISPLTTLVQDVMASTGLSRSTAEIQVKAQTGLNVSLFEDFSKSATQESKDAATLARMAVLATQKQVAAIGNVVGSSSADGTLITQSDVNKAVRIRVLELLPSLIALANDPSVQTAATPASKDLAMSTVAFKLIADSGIKAVAMPNVVAINTQKDTTVVTASPSTNTLSLHTLRFTDTANFFSRFMTGSTSQNTPDLTGHVKYVDRKYQATAGTVAQWGFGDYPRRQSDLHWNGSIWTSCPINFEHTQSLLDAQGAYTYNYCDSWETGISHRALFDISGKAMADVFNSIRAAGYTNLSIGDNSNATVVGKLGADVMPAGSELRYLVSTTTSSSIIYYPGVGNQVRQYSAAVAAGGIAANQAAGVACNSTEANASPVAISATLEDMVASMTGTPCIFADFQAFTYNGVTYTSPDRASEWWGNSTIHIGAIGNFATSSTVPAPTTAPGYYSGNNQLRVAFKGNGTNPVTYYSCKERFYASPRNCVVIGTGSYSIAVLGDARVMTFNNMPFATAQQYYNRVFVERGGKVYFGGQNKPAMGKSARMNSVAATALFTKLGIASAISDPATPIALTNASFAGNYIGTFGSSYAGSFNVTLGLDGVTSCLIYQTNSPGAGPYGCTLSLTGVSNATADISVGVVSSGANFIGKIDFYTGAVSGTWSSAGGSLGTFAGARQ